MAPLTRLQKLMRCAGCAACRKRPEDEDCVHLKTAVGCNLLVRYSAASKNRKLRIGTLTCWHNYYGDSEQVTSTGLPKRRKND